MHVDFDIPQILATLRGKKPLVHHITNWVTIYDCANATRAIGALPVMAHAPEEVEQMSGISSALVLNIGTLTPRLVDTMLLAGKSANAKGIPIVLDAVGAGATDLRTKKALELIEKLGIGIIKGNAGEIATLAGASAEVKGVESIGVEGNINEIAKKLSETSGAVVVVTGAQDIIADAKKNRTYKILNGHERMGSVVGTGCVSASIIGSFAAVEPDLSRAAASALCCYGIAGELASLNEHARGPGTYLHALIDELALLDAAKIREMQRVE